MWGGYMDLVEQLKKCSNPYETLKFLNVEYRNDLLNNITVLINLWDNYDISILLRSMIESGIFEKQDLKTILFEIVSNLESRGIFSNSILSKFGNLVDYSKVDFKRLFFIIISSRIENLLRHSETQAININKKLYDVTFNNDKEAIINMQREMLELIIASKEKWNLKITENDLIELISWKCKEEKIREFFVDKPMVHIKKYLEKLISRIVDEELKDEMELLGGGSYSIVFKKGDKVTKVSFSDEEYTSYDCDCILNFASAKTERFENGIPIITVGSQNLANCNWYNGLSQESINLKMYEVFCKAKDSGYIIADIKKENFGIVNQKLKVIDCGFIYKEKDFDISNVSEYVPLTTREIFTYFMELYNEGYRVDSDNQLVQSGKKYKQCCGK